MFMGLLTHLVRVPVRMDVDFVIQLDFSVFHAQNLIRCFGEKIEFVGDQHVSDVQAVEHIDQF
jgi:hypothetical protein